MKLKDRNYLGRDLKKARQNDKIDTARRSSVMSKIRSSGTNLELRFFNDYIAFSSVEFERNCKLLKGKPDMVFWDQKVCVFIDSDFWHGWQFPRWSHLLKNEFWIEKIRKNRERDRKTTAYLRYRGWAVIRVWEHNIRRNLARELNRVNDALQEKDRSKNQNHK